MLSKKSFIIIFFGIFCFIFSCLSFSSELSVKATSPTQQSAPSMRPGSEAQQEEENTEPLLTDKEYNAILDSSTPPNYYNFKRVLEYMDITSLKEYLDFLETLEVEHFPKSPKKYYGNQWEGWSQKSVIEPIDKKTDKSIEFSVNKILELDSEETEESKREEALKLNRQEVLKLKREEALKLKREEVLKLKREKALKLKRENKLSSYKSLSPKHQNKKTKKPSHLGPKKKDWMSFKKAKEHIQKEGIKTYTEFKEWSKTKRPPNFPSNPNITYKKEWISWFDFLGKKERRRFIDWMSFAEAQNLIQKEGIKTVKQFLEWKRAGHRPPHFPSNPQLKYKEWVSWPHFFGTERRGDIEWMSFEEAQAYIQQKTNIKKFVEFQKWVRSKNRPPDFPMTPDEVYNDKWKGWPHFLGKKWMSFAEARAFIQKEGIKTSQEFYEWRKSDKRPPNLPTDPHRVYKEDWVSWFHFFGTERRGDIEWMSFAEARAFIQKEGIKTATEFKEWRKSDKRPPNFPTDPHRVYKEDWVSWPHWMSFKKARAYIQKKGIKTYTGVDKKLTHI